MKFYEIIHRDLKKIKGQVISIIGGGGKTSLLYKIGKELAKRNFKVILTTTTKLPPQLGTGLALTGNGNFDSELSVLLNENNIVLVAEEYYKKDALKGLSRSAVSRLGHYADIVLVEADGCRRRSLKTHKEYEPPIPAATNTVIIICGANVVGQPLNEDTVHRWELFSQKWNLPCGTVLTPEVISNELLSPYSYFRNIPLKAEIRLFVNKTDANSIGGKLLADHLITRCSYPVFSGSITENTLHRVSRESL
ncbi:putative selenium-dependent hydroxylase accessory protein YqeC [candidate division KSB1 bacterium]|nr:putative selenium-dependent hydroxylase accessory protein YqeC [candidate division KSB1 bacterium]NIR71269.1 putative selenium-dependent hydroxylase accessory protein YqeC [candidate division KSB1 bacterium]NIS24798.1 putative selenium-dependent hydroxylase accessory protein YqeC [candidate division KSB1 bacterium]NIT71705.1 putative selenium-dependent hydroxylase accessory protein YqeC [candidate division KSB1 bacterium]NIU25434.1 putative selenium-dependent hydroxylase accessory protein Yq